MMTAEQAYQFSMLVICLWREARGESEEAMRAVAWVIKNRVNRGGWFGKTYCQVITKPGQFSSFGWPNHEGVMQYDANATKIPDPQTDQSAVSCLYAAKTVFEGSCVDPTDGACYYFDDSMAAKPPSWAKGFIPTVKIGRLNFFRDK